jgi:glycosyltransferase involved in cell wall biosynthesis
VQRVDSSVAETVRPSRDEREPTVDPVVDIVIPVHNEESVLACSVERLQAYLVDEFPFTWAITIADNASTDGTLEVATALAERLRGVRVVHLGAKGRGRALRQAWSQSDGDVVAYMDADLSTDLDALLPLVAPLVSGHSDVAIGSRLAPGAAVARGPRREAISRSYNLIVRALFATQVRDMQCGFKAVRRDVASALLTVIEDDAWFFDTELLLLAERNGLRIHQVPVDWTDDPDSRVHVTQTARDDLRGLVRLAISFARGQGRIDVPNRRAELDDDLGRRLVTFGIIGAVSTVATTAIFLLTRDALGAIAANALALTVTFLVNTWLNARFSYRAERPRWRAVTLIFAGTLVVSTAVLLGVDAAGGGVWVELVALMTVWALAGAVRVLHLNRHVRGGAR